MKKKLLFLTAWLLTAANAETWAQKTVTDFAGLKQAVGIVESIPSLQKNVDEKKKEVTAAENAVTDAQRTVSERELAVKEKEAVVTEKTKAVVPLQKVLDEKKKITAERQKAVDEATSVLNGLKSTPQYPTSGTKIAKMDNPFLVEINNFLKVVRREKNSPGSSGVTKEEAKAMQVYYRVKRTVVRSGNKNIVTFFLDITNTAFANLESQKNPVEKGHEWIPVDATIAFDAKLETEEFEGEEFEYMSYPNDIALKYYNTSNSLTPVVLGNGLLTISIYYCPMDVETDLESGEKEIVFVDSEDMCVKVGVGMSGEECSFLEFVDAMAEMVTLTNFPPLEYDEPIPNPNYQTWIDDVQAAKDDLGYKNENGEWEVGGKSKLLEDAQTEESEAQTAVDTAQGEVDTAQDAVDAANSAVTEAQKDFLIAQKEVDTANAAVTAAESEVTAANEYKKLTITGDNEFVVTETLADEWPADGVLRGNGNKIVNDANTPLFGYNYGSVSNLIAPNGSIASYIEAGAQVRACIVKTSSTEKPYRAYDDNGASNEYSTLPEAVYSMRGYFGYDAQNATATGKVASDTKLYKAQNKVASDTPMTDVYVNILGAGDVKYNAGSVSTVNTLLYLDDSAVKEDNKTVTATNVAVLESAVTDAVTGEVFKDYSCAEVQLVDGSANPEFYMPYSVKADELSYLRTTTTNKVPVCMPFELNADIKKLIAENVGTEVSNVFYYTLNEVKDGVVWFTPQASIGANKPGLIAFKEDVKLDGEKNIFAGLGTMEVSATPQIADLSAKPLNGGDEAFFGNYKPGQISSVLLQAHTGAGNAAYCYQGGQLVRMKEDASGSTKLNQFRSYVIMKEDAASPHSLPDSFEIGFQDEDGNEVTGIGTVESGMSDNGFKAVGGSGVIAITAEKACEVKVYTAGGSLVKAVRVEAGSTKLPFSAGMYIVNQTKVVVK